MSPEEFFEAIVVRSLRLRVTCVTITPLETHHRKIGARSIIMLQGPHGPTLRASIPNGRLGETGEVLGEPHFDPGFLQRKEPVKDGFAVAHELGHHLDREVGRCAPSEAEFRAAIADLSKPETRSEAIDVIERKIGDEESAWRNAETEVRHVGWTDLTAFAEERDARLHTYRQHRPEKD